MAQDVSAFGFVLTVIASNTFPNGFPVSAFADDSDPFDFPSIAVNDVEMGLNGDLISWSKATPLKTTMSVIPGSDEDQNLAILLEANRVGSGKLSARDVITVTAVYPDGSTLSLVNGKITNGAPSDSVGSSGRLKSKVYGFAFENRTVS